MISTLRIRGFKSVADTTFVFGRLTLLVGANASGKSNVLEAIHLLAWLGAGHRLAELGAALRDGALPIRGLQADLPTRGIGGTIGYDVTVPGGEVYRLDLAVDDDRVKLRQESLTVGGTVFYEVEDESSGPEHVLWIAYKNFRRGTNPQLQVSDEQPVFVQLVSPMSFPAKDPKARDAISPRCAKLTQHLRDFFFLDPRPEAMRGYAFRDGGPLENNGANLSAVLWRLWQAPELRTELLSFVRHLPEQEVTDIGFLETPRGEVMLQVAESFGDRIQKVEAALLSDGTLRVLAIAVALLTAPAGSVVLVEEIDSGVHPSRTRELLQRVNAVARARRLAIVVSSHNPALQDDLPLEAVRDVIACYRDAESGHTRLARLGDLPQYAELVARGPLGRLVTSRTLDQFLPGHVNQAREPSMDLSFLETGD